MSQGRNLRNTLLAVPGRVLGGFVIAIVTLIIVSVVTLQSLASRTMTSKSIERTFDVLRATETLLDDVNDSQLALTEFIITADPQFLEPFDAARRSIPVTLSGLRAVTANRPQAQAQLDELAPHLAAVLEMEQTEIEARRAGATVEELRPRLMEGKALLDQSSAILERIRDDTGIILDAEQRAHDESIRHSTVVMITGDAVLLTLILAAAALAVRDAAEKDRAVQFQRRVLGMVGHDLRNPLSVVMMSATQLAKTVEGNEKRQASVARILAAVNRMERMIRDLLDYSRIELKLALPLDIRAADVGTSCARIVEEFRAIHPTREIRYEPGERSLVHWDAERMEQVLENLLGNALKYSPAETPVRLAWRTEDHGITLEVSNGGPPIPPDLLPYVFEPFRRGRGHDARIAKNSLGLGLYIVRHIVAQHGGRIDVISTESEGTNFTLRLPRHAHTSTHVAA